MIIFSFPEMSGGLQEGAWLGVLLMTVKLRRKRTDWKVLNNRASYIIFCYVAVKKTRVTITMRKKTAAVNNKVFMTPTHFSRTCTHLYYFSLFQIYSRFIVTTTRFSHKSSLQILGDGMGIWWMALLISSTFSFFDRFLNDTKVEK